MEQNKTSKKTWDLFCRVVDNFGDVGVCWRLACQLAHEYQLPVRLWVDNISSLKGIFPHCEMVETQWLNGIEVRIWREDFVVDRVADHVIEAFACELPENYIAQMKLSDTPIQWLNLEYLSAESWVGDCHQLISMHPSTGLKKTYFFPGFNEATGGLIRENNLFSRRNQFIHSDQKAAFLTRLGLSNSTTDAILISLFSYENTAIQSLLTLWQSAAESIICFVPTGKTLNVVNHIFNSELAPYDTYSVGNLKIKVIPFLSQLDYDHLLWACDINFVRGEDSFVRAQWAGKPFIWHIYPQDDLVHLTKLRAFIEQHTTTTSPELNAAIQSLFDSWNQGDDCGAAWLALMLLRQQWAAHCQNWCNHLGSKPDLVSNLVQYCQKAL